MRPRISKFQVQEDMRKKIKRIKCELSLASVFL
jgi:hypothetical protein